jgi:hypothetical protein
MHWEMPCAFARVLPTDTFCGILKPQEKGNCSKLSFERRRRKAESADSRSTHKSPQSRCESGVHSYEAHALPTWGWGWVVILPIIIIIIMKDQTLDWWRGSHVSVYSWLVASWNAGSRYSQTVSIYTRDWTSWPRLTELEPSVHQVFAFHLFLARYASLLSVTCHAMHLKLNSASKLYRPSDRRSSA